MTRALFLAAWFAAVLAAQDPGAITGLVSTHLGDPLQGVSVKIATVGTELTTTTDAQGRYLVKDLKPTAYLITFTHPQYGTNTLTVILKPGQVFNGNVTFTPRGTISGRVVDENREPVADAMVAVFERRWALGALQYYPVGAPTQTDANGVYTVKQVAAGGPYFILAKANLPASTGEKTPAPDPLQRKHALVPTAFPVSPSLGNAERIMLAPLENREHLNIQMLGSLSFCFSGTVENATRAVGLILNKRDLGYSLATAWRFSAAKDGTFQLCGLPRGEYRLSAMGPLAPEEFQIADKDLTGLKLRATDDAIFRGRLSWIAEPPAPSEKAGFERLSLIQFEAGFSSIDLHPPKGDPSLEFSEKVPCGYYRVLPSLSPSLYLADIMRNGQPITDTLMLICGTTELTVVAGTDGATLSGIVLDNKDQPMPGANIAIVPTDAVFEDDIAAQLNLTVADPKGLFRSFRLKPGKYRVYAVGRDQVPALIDKIWHGTAKGKEIELTPRQEAEITLRFGLN